MIAQPIAVLQAVPIELAERRLRHFVRQAWHVVEPFAPFKPNWHLDAIADHLEAVERGEIRNLLVTMPPRMGKSLTISVFYPAWRWINKPGMRFLYASYSQDLATAHSLATRRVIESDWYRERWGDRFQLAGDANLKTRFENDQRGQRYSTSVGGVVTGVGGDRIVCLRYNQRIQTSAGTLPIGAVVEQRMPVRALSFNHERGQAEWQAIEAYEQSDGRPCLRVALSNGATIECTEDHPVYVSGRGYVAASALHDGDEVLTGEVPLSGVRQGVRSFPGAREAWRRARPLLLARVLGQSGARLNQPSMARRHGSAVVPAVRSFVLRQAGAGASRGQILLESLPEPCLQAEPSPTAQGRDGCVRSVRGGTNSEALDHCKDQFLLATMRQRVSLVANGRHGKPELATRIRIRTIRQDLPAYCPDHSGAGCSAVPALRQDTGRERQGVRRSPHRLRQDKRRSGESHQPVSAVPQPDPWEIIARSPVMGRAIVRAVEPIDAPDRVYNIRVAQNHNYFASGVLVHNCDDPHNVKEAESEAIRTATIAWWDQAMSTRFNDPKTGARIVVMQRVHEGDLAGHLIEQGGYTHLNLPMEYEPESVAWTGFGTSDPRSAPGELLAPDRVGPEELADLKVRLGSRAYAGQFQQRPGPAEGGAFRKRWWRFWHHPGRPLDPVPLLIDGELHIAPCAPLPPFWDEHIQSWDMSFKGLDTSDYVCGQIWGAWRADRYLLDQTLAQLDFPGTLAAVRELTDRWPKARRKLVEDKANGPAVIATLRNEIAGMVPVEPEGGKEARANAVTAEIESGNVYLPHPRLAPWVDAFIDECASFPAGKNDDQVDAMSQALLRLQAQSGSATTSTSYVEDPDDGDADERRWH